MSTKNEYKIIRQKRNPRTNNYDICVIIGLSAVGEAVIAEYALPKGMR